MNENKSIMQIEIIGNSEIITKDWRILCQLELEKWNKIKVNQFKTMDDYNNSFKEQKELKEYREKIKSTINKLDNPEISELRSKLVEIDKRLASINGDIDRASKKWKEDEKERQIEDGFSLIINQKNFQADIKVFEADYLEAIKGKTYKDFFEIAQKVAYDYSNILEMRQLKFDKFLIELKNYCQEIGYEVADDYLELLSKDVVDRGISIETQKEKLAKALQEKLEKEEKQKETDTNKIAEISGQNKNNDAEPTKEKKEDNINYLFVIDKMQLRSCIVNIASKKWNTEKAKEIAEKAIELITNGISNE